MLNMRNFISNPVADNEVVVNGAKFKVTDAVATQIMNLILNIDNVNVENNQPANNSVAVTKESKDTKEKEYKGLKDVKYHIKKQTSADGKTLFCISRGTPVVSKNNREYLKNGGFTSAEKACINNAIKSLDGITTIRVKVDFSFDAWGYKTKKQAEEMMATLPTTFTADEVAKFQKTKRA